MVLGHNLLILWGLELEVSPAGGLLSRFGLGQAKAG